MSPRLWATLAGLGAACELVPAATAPRPAAEPRAVGEATTALAALPVRELGPSAGYDRDQFGARWADIDRNGCDQRNDVLARDLQGATFREGTHECVVASGSLRDPYTGQGIAFLRGERTSDDVQVDHVVSLSNAWRTGAQALDAPTRERLANDPLNLLAVAGATNQSKGDSDASRWLPPDPAFRCAFAARQVAVKARYHLWVTPEEREALAQVLSACPAQGLPES